MDHLDLKNGKGISLTIDNKDTAKIIDSTADNLPHSSIYKCYEIVMDIKPTTQYLLVLTETSLQVVRKSTMAMLRDTSIEGTGIKYACMTATDRYCYVSTDEGEIVYTLPDIKQACECRSGISGKRRMTFRFEYRRLAFVGVLVDETPALAVLCHIRNRLTLTCSLDLKTESCWRVFNALHVHEHQSILVLTESSNSCLIKIMMD